MKLWILAVALAAAPAAASAQTADGGAGQSIYVTGEAPAACVLRAPRLDATTGAVFQSGGERAGTIDFTQLVDPQTSIARAASVSLALPVTCTGAHTLSVRALGGGLRQAEPATAAQGFRDRLAYRLSAEWAGQRAAASSESAIEIKTSNAASGELSLAVNVAEGGLPLVSGTYGDSIVIELLPVH
jgi:hypothetical protein